MQLHFNDYGYKEWLNMDCMRPIRNEFLKVAWMAQKCRLVDIFPLMGDVWPQATCEKLIALVHGNECFLECKVIMYQLVILLSAFCLTGIFSDSCWHLGWFPQK